MMNVLTFGRLIRMDGPDQDTFGNRMGDIAEDSEGIHWMHCYRGMSFSVFLLLQLS